LDVASVHPAPPGFCFLSASNLFIYFYSYFFSLVSWNLEVLPQNPVDDVVSNFIFRQKRWRGVGGLLKRAWRSFWGELKWMFAAVETPVNLQSSSCNRAE